MRRGGGRGEGRREGVERGGHTDVNSRLYACGGGGALSCSWGATEYPMLLASRLACEACREDTVSATGVKPFNASSRSLR